MKRGLVANKIQYNHWFCITLLLRHTNGRDAKKYKKEPKGLKFIKKIINLLNKICVQKNNYRKRYALEVITKRVITNYFPEITKKLIYVFL